MAVPVDESVRLLAQYRPFSGSDLRTRQILVDLIVAAMAEAGGVVGSLAEIKDACSTLWGLVVEIDEIRAAVDDLVALGKATTSQGAVTLGKNLESELALTRKQSEVLEQKAMQDWQIAVRGLAPGISEEDLQHLTDDLHLWLQALTERHGVEAALVLCPESPRAQQLFEDIEKLGLDFLPPRPAALAKLREQVLFLFARQPTSEQRFLLSNLMNTTYFLTLLSLDPNACSVVASVTSGQRVYLDTNFVYWVLNLHGPRHFLLARRILEMTRDLGYAIAVTPWTVKELRHSLGRARTFLTSRPLLPSDLAALAAQATTDEDFVTAYWRRLRQGPVSVQDFYDFYSDIESHLAEHGIEVINSGCAAVDSDKGIDEQLAIFDRGLGNGYRAEPVQRHDVKHRMLIARLRGMDSRGFANAGFWFLTCDSYLPRYDYAARGGKPGLPFCVTAGAWFQTMRAFTPRSEDWEQSLSDLLASPYVRFRGQIPEATVQEVVARIDLFTGRTPELAARVLLNTAMLDEVGATEDADSRKELIDSAVVVAAREIEKELDEAKRHLEAERTAREAIEQSSGQMEASLTAKEADLIDAQRTLASLQKELLAERQKADAERDQREANEAEDKLRYERRIGQLEIAVGDSQVAAEAAKIEAERARRMVRRWVQFSVAAVLVVGMLGLLWLLATQAIHGEAGITGLLGGLLLLSAGLLYVWLGSRAVWKWMAGVGLVIGILAGIYQLVAAAVP